MTHNIRDMENRLRMVQMYRTFAIKLGLRQVKHVQIF